MKSDAFIVNLAYPETIVKVADEWYSPFMCYFGIGRKNYVRAGHAAMVLIHKERGDVEYYDFGRYITPNGFGRVRNRDTDHELNFKLEADIRKNVITNLEEILQHFATIPHLTHGTGFMLASLNSEVDFKKAKMFLTEIQDSGFVKYAAFSKNATNCAKLVIDVLIESCSNTKQVKKLRNLMRFTPSVIGVVKAGASNGEIFKISTHGEVSSFNKSSKRENRRLFIDKLPNYIPNEIGTIKPNTNLNVLNKAQWLGGVGSGAWFELQRENSRRTLRFRRISSNGDVDTDRLITINGNDFKIDEPYKFLYGSNCKILVIEQQQKTFRFNLVQE